MELQHLTVKIPVDGALGVDPARVLEAFHRWIPANPFGEILVDVVDYRHVPAGPGVVLVGLESDFSLDQGGGLWGLRYFRKAGLGGSNLERLRLALAAAGKACGMLEREFAGALRFRRQEFLLCVNDRALAQNTPETLAACRADLEAFCQALGGGSFELAAPGDAKRLFGVNVRTTKALEWPA